MPATVYNWVDHNSNQIIDSSSNSLIFYNRTITRLSGSISISSFNDKSISAININNNTISTEKYNNINIGVS